VTKEQSAKQERNLSSIRQVFKKLILPRMNLVILGIVLIIISRFCAIILPYSAKIFIDDVVLNNNMALSTLLWVLSAAVTINAVSSFALTQMLSVEAQRVIADLRKEIQQHVIVLPLSFFDENKSGTLVSRIMDDVEGVRNLVGTGLVQLIGGIFQSCVALVLLLAISPSLTAIALLPLAIFGLVSSKAFAYIRPIFRLRRKIHSEVTGRLTESLGGIRVVKGFFAEKQEFEAFSVGVENLFYNIKRTLVATSLVTSSSVLLLGLTSVAIMALGSGQIQDGSITVGEFVSFTLILGFLVSPIAQMANIGTQITEAFAGLDRTDELLSQTPETENPLRTKTLAELKGDISFENVSFSYQEDNEVLRDISFVAESGSVTALVGSSGSGKTTLASLAASFLTPTKGNIYVDGLDLAEVTLESFRSRLGVVLQDDFLFEGSIRENILYANPNATPAELEDAVDSAYVSEFSERFDDGLDTMIGERGVKLSGGQRQRIAIARALIAKPRLLILDEATSNLDAESERYIQKSLATLMEGRTTLVIAHRLSTIKKADQILVIEKGQIVERGNHETLIAKEGRYHELYTYQVRI
jgi:subfamily B ATP-binding cassette protein MsbA